MSGTFLSIQQVLTHLILTTNLKVGAITGLNIHMWEPRPGASQRSPKASSMWNQAAWVWAYALSPYITSHDSNNNNNNNTFIHKYKYANTLLKQILFLKVKILQVILILIHNEILSDQRPVNIVCCGISSLRAIIIHWFPHQSTGYKVTYFEK